MNEYIANGRVTRKIQLAYTAQQHFPVARFTLAVDRETSDGGADFIPCEIWGKQAELMANTVIKGELIGIAGKLASGSYTNKIGDTVYTLGVKVRHFEYLMSKEQKDKLREEHARTNDEKPMESTEEHERKEPDEHQEEHQEKLDETWQYVEGDVPF